MKKQQVFYIHGGSAYTNYDDFIANLKKAEIRNLPGVEPMKKWPSTLREDLGDDFEVFMPQMPNALNCKYGEWKIWFERHFEYLQDDIILVGWSQGGYFFAKYLTENQLPFRIKKLILIASPFEPDNFEGEDGGDFVFDTTQVANIVTQVKDVLILHSKDDFWVPYEHALKFKAALPDAELVTFEDKNHFLIEEFPELVERVRELKLTHE